MTQQVEIIKVYEYHGDGGERGFGPILGYTANHADAVAATRGKGWYGGDAHISTLNCIKIGDECYVLKQTDPIRLDGDKAVDDARRARLMAQLTPEDKRVLGIK
jgi:hypothetical protein